MNSMVNCLFSKHTSYIVISAILRYLTILRLKQALVDLTERDNIFNTGFIYKLTAEILFAIAHPNIFVEGKGFL